MKNIRTILMLCFFWISANAQQNVILDALEGDIPYVSKCAAKGFLAVGLPANSTDIQATQVIDVNVLSSGPYNLVTPTVNGVIFSASGVFTFSGWQPVELVASGTPMDYTVNANEFIYTVSNTTATPISPGSCFSFSRKVYVPDQNYTGTIRNDGAHRFLYKVIADSNGQHWLQTNLGSQYNLVGHPDFNPEMYAQGINDYKAYGSLFQSARNSDGHELVNWTSATMATGLSPTTTAMTADSGLFYTSSSLTATYGVKKITRKFFTVGPGMPCPNGFLVACTARVTPEAYTVEGIPQAGYNAGAAYWLNNTLKLVAPQLYRDAASGSLISMPRRLIRTNEVGLFPDLSATSPQYVIEGGTILYTHGSPRDRRAYENQNDRRGPLDAYPIRCFKPLN